MSVSLVFGLTCYLPDARSFSLCTSVQDTDCGVDSVQTLVCFTSLLVPGFGVAVFSLLVFCLHTFSGFGEDPCLPDLCCVSLLLSFTFSFGVMSASCFSMQVRAYCCVAPRFFYVMASDFGEDPCPLESGWVSRLRSSAFSVGAV